MILRKSLTAFFILLMLLLSACTTPDGGDSDDDDDDDTVNNIPVAKNITVSGSLSVDSILTASYIYFDLEGDAESGSKYKWFSSDEVNGVFSEISGENGITYTIKSSDSAKYLKVGIIPKNAASSSDSNIYYSAVLGPVSLSAEAPTAKNVEIEGTVKVNMTVTGVYTYSDANGDAESGSVYRWLVSDTSAGTYTAVAGATAKTFKLISGYQGKFIKFEVTPCTTVEPKSGTAVVSSPYGPVEAGSTTPEAPVASALTITGSTECVSMLTGTYNFSDANGDSEGTSTFRWLSSSTVSGTYSAISGATAKTLATTTALKGKYVKFEVTPVSTVAPTTGTAVLSDAYGPFTEEDTVKPTVTGINPESSATGISAQANIVLTFSENLNTGVIGTVKITSPQLTFTNGSNCSITVSNNIVTVNPNSDFAYQTTYTGITITGFEDLSGNVMNADTRSGYSFTTAAAGVVSTPLISPVSQEFTDSVNVTITCATSGAVIRYTTDGNDVTTSSSIYGSSLSVTATTTVKAKAFLTGYETSSQASTTYTKKVISDDSAVMLQGFHWNSVVDYKNSWYAQISAKKDDIKANFGYVWYPPASIAGDGPRTGYKEGYVPTELNNLTGSQYGNYASLTQSISDISPAKAIADVVVNHRDGANWGNFANPDFGVVAGSNYKAICSDDEFFTNTASPGYGKQSLGGATDSGDIYGCFRDIDHTNTTVQSQITTWMNDVLKNAGFVGWRYDYVKGFNGKYVGQYNKNTSAAFSVGEYWPTAGFDPSNSSVWKGKIVDWINQTAENGGMKSKAFDFVLKGNMNYAFGYKVPANNEDKTSLWDMSKLADSNNIFRCMSDYAVTFVDNHDTGSTQQHWELDPYDVYLGYVLILTHPGVPSVAWQHYFTGSGTQFRGSETAPGTGKTYHDHIKFLIDLRKAQGLKYNSSVSVQSSSSSLYAAIIDSKVAVKIGGNSWTPSGSDWTQVYYGTNFAIWTKGSSGPSISVSGSTDFGTVTAAATATFTITNSGSGTLNLTGSPVVALSGSSTFTVVSQPSLTSLSAGQSTTFSVKFDPSTDGSYTSAMSIANSSSSGTYTATLTGSKGVSTKIKLTMKKDVGVGNAVYFTRSFTEAATWTKAIQGTYNSASAQWECEINNPGTFTWKVLKGTYGTPGAVVTISGGGLTWESDPNHTQDNYSPTFNGGF